MDLASLMLLKFQMLQSLSIPMDIHVPSASVICTLTSMKPLSVAQSDHHHQQFRPLPHQQFRPLPQAPPQKLPFQALHTLLGTPALTMILLLLNAHYVHQSTLL